MALTQGAWSTKSANGFSVHTCSIVVTALDDAYTLKTPKGLDPKKQWLLYVTTSATGDQSAIPVDLWVGFSDSFALSGNEAVAATDGANFKQIADDIVLAVDPIWYCWVMDPYSVVTDDVTYNAGAQFNVKVPIAPYYAFNLDGGSDLATTITWKIVQKADGQAPLAAVAGIGADPS